MSSALAGEAEKEEAGGCSGAPAQAECRHACPDRHSPEEEAVEEAECRRRRRRLVRKVDELLPP